jgi:hypothetical protein
MNKRILAPVVGLLVVIPGAIYAFMPPSSGTYHPPTSRPPVYHTPAFTPRPVYRPPVYHPPVTHSPPPVIHRPGFVPSTTRPPVVYHPPPTVIRPSGINRWSTFNNRSAWVNRGIYINRPNGIYWPGYAHYYPWYAGWHHGYWHGWYNRPWLWFGSGVAVGWLLSPGESVVYWNPYYAAPTYPTIQVFDYSRPIQVSAPTQVPESSLDSYGAPPPTTEADANTSAAMQDFDSARAAFKANDYAQAEHLIDSAIQRVPNDATMHEFRSLALFAEGKYQDASSTIYAVLAVAPGWDWETLRALYPDAELYTSQLRALENFVRENPANAAARFLLAYHYLVIDARDAAARMLRTVVELQPKDQLAVHLLKMLEQKPEPGRPVPKI